MGPLERGHLALIQALDETGTLTAAADRLHLSQSALSHSLAKLEDQLGVVLWHREGRRLRPTQAGRFLVAAAHRLVPQFDRLEERLGQFARGERGTLTVGMECHPCYQWLLPVAAAFLEAWPEVEFDVRQRFQFGGLGALFAHEIDLLVTPDPVARPGIVYEPVFAYEPALAVAANHRLAGRPWVTAEDLADEVLFTYPVPVDRLDVFSRFLTPAGILPRRHKTAETTELLVHQAASGRGVAALPRWLIEAQDPNLGLVALSLGAGGLTKTLSVGSRETDAGLDYLEGFLSLARGVSALPRGSAPVPPGP